MPLDPSIYNTLQAPPSPLSILGQVQKARAQDLDLQNAQLEQQQRQQAFQDDQAFRQVLQQHGGDVDAAMPDLMKAAPARALAVQKQLLEGRQQAALLHKTDLEGQGKALEIGTQILNSITDQPSYTAAKKAISGLAPNVAAQMPDQYDPGVVDRLKAVGTSAKDWNTKQHEAMDDALKMLTFQRGTPEYMQKATKALGTYLSTAQTPQQWDAFMKGAGSLGIPAEVVSQFPQQFSPAAVQQAAQMAMTPTERAERGEASQRIGLEGQRVKIEGARLAAEMPKIRAEAAKANMEAQQLQQVGAMGGSGAASPDVQPGQKNDAFLSSLSPAIAAQVKALADGRMQFPSGFALRSPYWQGLLQAVAKYDPTFDAVNYNARAKTRADFTSGKSAQQVNAINTVLGHLDGLSDAAEALHNSNIPAFNSIANALSKATGRPNVTNYNTIKKAVSDEVTRVWRQAGGSEKDIEAAQANLDAAGSPEQLRQAIATYGDLLQSKLGSLNEQYRQGMGTDKVNILSPQAQQSLNKIEARAGKAQAPVSGITVTAPNGKVYTFKTQADADAFKAKAGIK